MLPLTNAPLSRRSNPSTTRLLRFFDYSDGTPSLRVYGRGFQSLRLIQAEEQVKILHRLAGSSLGQVVNGGDHYNPTIIRIDENSNVNIIAAVDPPGLRIGSAGSTLTNLSLP